MDNTLKVEVMAAKAKEVKGAVEVIFNRSKGYASVWVADCDWMLGVNWPRWAGIKDDDFTVCTLPTGVLIVVTLN